MTFFDIILIIILLFFAFRGFSLGLIRMVGSLIGTIVGAIAASYFYLNLFNLIKDWFNDFENLGKVVCFLVVFIVASNIIVFLFNVLDKAYNFISIIPFLKTINRLGGAILGFLVGSLILGLIIYVVAKYAVVSSLFGNLLVSSEVAPFLLILAKILMPLLSISFNSIRSII